MESDYLVVFVTSPGVETSTAVASALVEERIAACVNILPGIRSVYRWEGKVQEDREELLVIKTKRNLFDVLVARVKELHPYDVPEVIAMPVDAGSRDYLDWISESTSDP